MAFTPQISEVQHQGLFYDDGFVLGGVEILDHGDFKALSIYEWSSREPGCGHTVRALTWLREQGFTHIAAHGVGRLEMFDGNLVPDTSTLYWAHLVRKGLVQEMFDDEGVELLAQPDGSIVEKPTHRASPTPP